MDEAKAKKSLQEFLYTKQIELSAREGRYINQSEIARRIDVSQGSLNQYFNGTRLPGTENVNKIAAHFGPEIYTILGQPQQMPDNPLLRKVASYWNLLPLEYQEQFTKAVEGKAAQEQKRVAGIMGTVSG